MIGFYRNPNVITYMDSPLARALNIPLLALHPYLVILGFFIFVTVISFDFPDNNLRDIIQPKKN